MVTHRFDAFCSFMLLIMEYSYVLINKKKIKRVSDKENEIDNVNNRVALRGKGFGSLPSLGQNLNK